VRELRGGIATFGTWGTARYYPGTDIVAVYADVNNNGQRDDGEPQRRGARPAHTSGS